MKNPDPDEREHAHHAELRDAHSAACDEGLERLRQTAHTEALLAISSGLARLELFTAGHERAIGIYLAKGDHKKRIRALDRATDLRRAQVLALQRLLAMPVEALLVNEDFAAFARAL